jgi:hypothetical protein
LPKLIASEELYSILQRGSINSLLCSEPLVRNYFIGSLVPHLLKKGKIVMYLDIDSYFTASIMKEGSMPENLSIIYPRGEEIDDAFITLLSWTKPKFDMLVIDSLTTFYHISPIAKFSSKNRKLGFYLAMLREFAKRVDAPVLVVSHQIYRKVDADWRTAYSGGRVLNYHSSLMIRASIEQAIMRLVLEGKITRNLEVPLN